MSDIQDSFSSFHWQMEMLQSIDAGLIVLDREYRVQLWNGFMENHSGLHPSNVMDKVLFDLFEEVPVDWFKRKAETVFKLNNRAFTTWEQRPYIFKFHNYRPLSGISSFMYQNLTMIPLRSTTATIDHICLIIYDVTDIATNKQQLNKLNDQLEMMSRIDRLSSLYNRGHWEELLEREFNRYIRTDLSSTLVMLDIDHFKQINDTHGHQSGDEVIRVVAKCIKKTARDSDLVGRYGGEEFGVILINTDIAQARYFAERLRKNIEQQIIEYQGLELSCTISLGISETTHQHSDYDAWLKSADQALYQSKADGRNRVTEVVTPA